MKSLCASRRAGVIAVMSRCYSSLKFSASCGLPPTPGESLHQIANYLDGCPAWKCGLKPWLEDNSILESPCSARGWEDRFMAHRVGENRTLPNTPARSLDVSGSFHTVLKHAVAGLLIFMMLYSKKPLAN